jgi:DNA-binding helix-hairpin-helix protein with protein kinase domain
MMSWLEAFGLTVAIEAPLVALAAPAGKRRDAAIDSLAFNLMTHPCAWWSAQHWPEHWTAIELAVLAAETVGYALATRIGWRRGFVLAAVANVVTAALSFALM